MTTSKTKRAGSNIKQAVISWWDNDPFTQSAAVAYYTIFSFPALMILYFASASIFMDQGELKAETIVFLSDHFGEEAAKQLKDIIDATAPKTKNFWAFLIGGATLMFAALRLFLQLQKALNNIWQVDEDRSKGMKIVLVRRLISFGVMIGIGFSLVVSLLVTSMVSFLTQWVLERLPDMFAVLLNIINISLLFATITFMFTILLKTLPDAKVRWKHARQGAALSAALFLLGEYLMGIYFSIAKPGSAYGVTGSLILLMLWVSYSCVILLLGAELSHTLHLNDKKQRNASAA